MAAPIIAVFTDGQPKLLTVEQLRDIVGITSIEKALGIYAGDNDERLAAIADAANKANSGVRESVVMALDKIIPIEVQTEILQYATADSAAAIRQAVRDSATLSQALLRVVSELNRTRVVMRDAGFVVDPVSGTVRLYALDQVADRTSKAEIALDAVKASVSLKVSVDQMNAAILKAQLDPSSQADFEAIIARMTQAEIRLGALEGQILLKADAVTVTTMGGIVTGVQTDLNALKGEVSTKASTTTVQGLTQRVASAEQKLLAYGDVSSLTTELRQARLENQEAGRALLAGLAASEDANQRQVLAIAQNRQELYALTTSGLAAEAYQRNLLAARTGSVEASLATEIRVRTDQYTALAQSLTEMGVRLGNSEGLIVSLQRARIDDQAATAVALDQVRASVKSAADAAAAVDARVTREVSALAAADSAAASSLTQVVARLDGVGQVGLEQSFRGLVDRLGKVEGVATLAIDINGNVVGYQLIGSASGPGSLNLINTDLRLGTGRVVFNNGTFMWVMGLGFGRNRDLISWYGPTMAIDQCTRANGLEWKGTDGVLYTAAAIKAGPYTNSGSSTLIASDASFSLGPFTSNGGSKVVVASYTFRRVRLIAPGGGGAVSGSPSATLALEYQLPGGGWSQIGTIQTGQPTLIAQPATGQDPGRLEEAMSGSVTWTDTRTLLEGYVYRLRLTARQQANFSGTAQGADSVTQSLSIISQE